MSYPQYPGQQPQYPGGQSYPGQQPYPQSAPVPAQPQPGGFPAAPGQSGGYPAQPYPQAPYPAQPYGLQPQKPSGGTAITAGVLALLGGIWYLIAVVGSIVTMVSYNTLHWAFVLALVEDLLIAGTLLPGGIMLFMRKPAGRMMTIVGSSLAILSFVVALVLAAIGGGILGARLGGGLLAGTAIGGVVLVLVPAIVTLILAIVKPTARWCSAAEQPYQLGYAPQPGGRPPGY